MDALKSQAAYGNVASKYSKKRGRDDGAGADMGGSSGSSSSSSSSSGSGDLPSQPPAVKRAKRLKATLSAAGMRDLVQSKGGRITDRDLIKAFKHKLDPTKNPAAIFPHILVQSTVKYFKSKGPALTKGSILDEEKERLRLMDEKIIMLNINPCFAYILPPSSIYISNFIYSKYLFKLFSLVCFVNFLIQKQ